MEADYGTPTRARDDALYDEGLAHAQAGEWTAALRCFEALAERYPGDADVARALDQARFKARLDEQARVRPRSNVNIHWGRILMRSLILVLLIAVVYFAVQFAQTTVAPALAAQRARQAFDALVAGCRAAAGGVDTAAARAACERALNQDPNNAEAKALLVGIEQKEKEQAACKTAEDAIAAGNYADALNKFMDIQMLYPGACRATERINALRDRQSLEGLFAQCVDAAAAGNHEQVINACEQVRSRNTTYQAETVSSNLFAAYFALGKQIIEQVPPQVEQLPLALDYFTRALQFRPKDTDALGEQRLASQYLAGQQAFQSARLDDAITALAAVVELRPSYLARGAAERLYDAYLRRGDQYRDTGDVGMAYRMYDLAANVPGVDHASAINRRDSVVGSLTPTPTPTNTPTPTPIPTATPYVPPPPPAPPTAAPPLGTFRGKIVFQSDKADQAGFWVMNPDGTQRRYLGNSSILRKEYQALREREAYSPDGRFRAYALRANGDSSVQIYWQGINSDGYTITQRVTDFGKISYDPVWSPDGSKIAFVSAALESDDIWVADPQAKSDPKNLTANPWQWDKHPSWSPDSRQIVFWSNRDTKRMLIWVMNADGSDVRCISADCKLRADNETSWQEFDPIWIK